jgi:hypothetical protein
LRSRIVELEAMLVAALQVNEETKPPSKEKTKKKK